MVAQQSRSSSLPRSDPQGQCTRKQTKGMSNIRALLGTGLALLGLLYVAIGVMRGVNALFSLLVGLLAFCLFALCYHASTRSIQTSPHIAMQERSDIVPPIPVASIPDIPYIPIEQDELFQLDRPKMGEYVLYLPKEGEALVECQDRFALNADEGRYAIADGVSGSFAPGPWARIVARGFVEYAFPQSALPGISHTRGERQISYCFGDRSQFEQWVRQCRNTWYQWMRERWVPTMNVLHEGSLINWDFEIEQGAQTTLTGCWLLPQADLSNPYIDIFVSVIGDSEFFLFRRDEWGAWRNVTAFPFTSADEFDSHPLVLATKPKAELLERAWNWQQEFFTSALPGDRIVLATDTLAKWIITQLQSHMTAWTMLLDSTDSSFHEHVLRQELHENRMEDDDLTMLVIPISSSWSESNR